MKYGVKVAETHGKYVWVEANSPEEAERKAVEIAERDFEYVYSSEFTGETED